MSEKTKEYKLTSIEDIASIITIDNFECLILDIANCFKNFVQVKEKHPELKMKQILWKDVQNVDMTGVQFLDKEGKVIRRKNFKKKK